jgi:hypothetical protein
VPAEAARRVALGRAERFIVTLQFAAQPHLASFGIGTVDHGLGLFLAVATARLRRTATICL